jgi:hypothetical protein
VAWGKRGSTLREKIEEGTFSLDSSEDPPFAVFVFSPDAAHGFSTHVPGIIAHRLRRERHLFTPREVDPMPCAYGIMVR